MLLRKPSCRKKIKKIENLNLIPILDAVFIFIFFLLMSANFIKIFEIPSDVPVISESREKLPKKIPLSLTLKIKRNAITILTGIPSKVFKVLMNNPKGEYRLEELHSLLIGLKKQNMTENLVLLEPDKNIQYLRIIEIMDTVRMLKNTDESLFKKNKNNVNIKVDKLFDKIIFSNVTS